MEFCLDKIIAAESFVVTTTGNYISRSAVIKDPRALEIPSGKCFVDEEAVIESDLAPIQLNRHCFICKNVKLKPCRTFKEPIIAVKMTIGANTFIGEGCEIEAARIGSGCSIGRNVKIGARCIIKDFVLIQDDAVVLSDMVLPPFAIVAGNPATIVGEQSEIVSTLVPLIAVDRYKAIKAV